MGGLKMQTLLLEQRSMQVSKLWTVMFLLVARNYGFWAAVTSSNTGERNSFGLHQPQKAQLGYLSSLLICCIKLMTGQLQRGICTLDVLCSSGRVLLSNYVTRS